ncbi:sigma 54 modulation/S30EA ribosomal C-terminal domain-containing protein [Nocardia asteroides]|uniref:sigma 54 modulation/S30EA ribosomal C-terminal domain-containing protein n=1 Tax=Nocardia asteroides TaxID=1824 RepID=UPI001E5426D4|nr:sigma 54 modulation/S30EA ribosomal C-terminal domain-containing protein [Nocardia asteroides]UGT60838.1 sigma 54 modulation/S30EA ribosomal C-terminal domain-containing protein [Nocardia asteroides]
MDSSKRVGRSSAPRSVAMRRRPVAAGRIRGTPAPERAVQQWTTAGDPVLAVTTSGEVEPAEVTRAVRAIGRVLRRHRLDATTRVRVTAPARPGEPTLVQANLCLRDLPTRVQVTGPRGFAVTFAAERLDRRLARAASGEARAWPDPARPPLTAVTAVRPIVRGKQCLLLDGTVAEAAAILDAMDYEAYLFVDAETGEDAVVHWVDGVGAGLIRQRCTRPAPSPMTGPLQVGALTVRTSTEPAPVLTKAAAAHRLCRAGLPFLFFTDTATGRGALLYRRYDGDLTLVTPATAG